MGIHVDASSEAIVQAFGEYQRVQRGLAERTVYNSAFVVRAFLAWRAEAGRFELEELRSEELGDFILHEAGRLKPRGMPATVSTVRTFVRFLFATGVIDRDLSGAVPSVRTSRFGALPVGVGAEVLEQLLDSCELAPLVGRRDYAVLLLMSRLGLRASEISRMRLEDIDWRSGEVTVRSKGARRDRLPLPKDVGEAIVDYLRRGRAASASRAVFLAARAPAGMSRNAVVFVSRRASKRLGIRAVGGHRLRHTAGTELLRNGATLREVGQVLRHDDSTTTAIYAKVDISALASAVRPWSEGDAR